MAGTRNLSARPAASLARTRIATWSRLNPTTESSDEDVQASPRTMPRHTDTKNRRAGRSSEIQPPEWYVAIDFGTTFTTVAWYRRGMPIRNIQTIDNFPGETRVDQVNNQIPTELWYPRDDARPSRYVHPDDIRLRFGNEVHRIGEGGGIAELRAIYDDADRMTMMKLLLDKSDYTQAAQERLQKTLESLKVKHRIEEDSDVILHFFQEVFKATKTRLGFDFKAESTVEVTLCVPVCYSASAVAILSGQLERAMKEVQFGTDGDRPCNMFIVHEAEAQAMKALEGIYNELECGETFVLVDCGGGTTDIGIYRIASIEPFRLGTEVHEAMGAMVGACDLNDKFRSLLRIVLRGERYLETEGCTIDDIITNEVMPTFEKIIKRTFQYNNVTANYGFRVRGLRESRHDHRVRSLGLVLSYQDIWNIFRPSLKKIGTMMEDAVINAKNVGYAVSKVVVVGGFGDSPCLQSYLLEQRDRIVQETGSAFELKFPPRDVSSATGVATGAILRTIDKVHGPSRKPCQSIGILRHIPCDDEGMYPAEVMLQPRTWSDPEQEEFVMNTIEWVVKKGDRLLDSVHTVTFKSEHTFKPEDTDWVLEEQLWASPDAVIDFYKLDHPHNSGKTMQIGAVEFDMADMRQHIRVANMQEGEKADKVVILVEMTVIDRNLEFTARWPATEEGQIIQGSRKFFSVASLFTPGTQ